MKTISLTLLFFSVSFQLAVGGDTHVPIQVAQDGTTVSASKLDLGVLCFVVHDKPC